MKNKLIILLCLMATVMQANAGVTWSSENGFNETAGIDLYDRYGDALAFDSFTFYFAEYTGTETEISTAMAWADFDIDNAQSVSYSSADAGVFGFTAGQFYNQSLAVGVAQESKTYYTLIESDAEAMFAVASSSYTFGDSSISFSTIDIDIGTVSSIDWVAVPEPATLLIFGPGLVGLFGYRRRKDKIGQQLTALFERRRSAIAARKALMGTEREAADYVTPAFDLIAKLRSFDPLGNALLAIDNMLKK
jgi:hypothetical protein